MSPATEGAETLGMLLVGGDTALVAPWAQCDVQGHFHFPAAWAERGRASKGAEWASRISFEEDRRARMAGKDARATCKAKGTRGEAKG